MTPAMKHRVLITGGSGFIGRHLVARLAEEGRAVIATTTHETYLPTSNTNVEWVTWDVHRETSPAIDWPSIDTIVHLAKPRSAIQHCEAHAANHALSVTATYELLCRARYHGVRRFLFASTGYVLGPCDALARETDCRYRPREPYGVHKACGELITSSFANELSTANVRLFFPYGPEGDRYFVNRIVRSVWEGKEIRIDGAEGVRLNPVWIDDLVTGLVLAIDSTVPGTFHFAGSEIVDLRQLATQIGRMINRRPVFRHEPANPADWHVGDMTLAQSKLGFRPRTDLDHGLGRLIDAGVEAAA